MVEKWMKSSNKKVKAGFSWNKPMKAKHKGKVAKLFSDYDKDGVPNVFDCKPRNPKKQGWSARGHTFPRERTTHVKMMKPDKFVRTTFRESQKKFSKDSPYSSQKEYEGVLHRENIERLKK